VRAFGYGYLKACYQLPPRSSMAYNPNFTIARQYDPAKAKQLLTEAGYPNGFDTTIRVFSDATLNDIITAVQGNLAAVGIKAKLEFPEIGTFMQYMFGGGSWPTNSVLFQPLPGVETTYVGGLQQIFNTVGNSWARSDALTQAYKTAISSTLDVQKVRAVTDMISGDCSLIPISESGAGVATQPYLVADVNNRGIETYWNFQDFWMNNKPK
jgi:ABC-type transport system substrate-binding protein